ncbi:MAG TPA: hypothetical protein VFB45_15445 [Pseudolabrys sp.]|nr:hypothetical protein [Pseudolabrys sp.]
MLGCPKIRAGRIGGKGTKESKRASHYANPPSNPGLNGLQLDRSPGSRRGYTRAGVVGTASYFARKGEPL